MVVVTEFLKDSLRVNVTNKASPSSAGDGVNVAAWLDGNAGERKYHCICRYLLGAGGDGRRKRNRPWIIQTDRFLLKIPSK